MTPLFKEGTLLRSKQAQEVAVRRHPGPQDTPDISHILSTALVETGDVAIVIKTNVMQSWTSYRVFYDLMLLRKGLVAYSMPEALLVRMWDKCGQG